MNKILKRPKIERIILAFFATALYFALAATIGLAPVSDRPQEIMVSELQDGLSFDLLLHPPTLEVESRPEVEVQKLNYRGRSKGGEKVPDEICIDSIEIAIVWPVGPRWQHFVVMWPQSDHAMCYELELVRWSSGPNGQETVLGFESPCPWADGMCVFSPQVGTNHFWYPYDSFKLGMSWSVRYHEVHDKQTLATKVSHTQGSIYIPDALGWKVVLESISDRPTSAPDLVTPESIVVGFERPLFERVILPSIVLIMLFFILLLCLVDTVGTFIEGGVAVFFGIFGLSQILLPRTAEIHTIIDVAIWGLYFAFAGALIHHLLSALSRALRRDSDEQSGPKSEEGEAPDPKPELPQEGDDRPLPKLRHAQVLLVSLCILLSGWILAKVLRRK